MDAFLIDGGKRLSGSVTVHGAKNSVLPILAASIINNGDNVIHNCPDLSDVDASIRILQHLGCKVIRQDDTISIDSRPMCRYDIPDGLMREMRSSVIFLGAILARAGQASMSLPGGCELGPRPINLHLSALKMLGAVLDEQQGKINCLAENMKGCEINLELPSVGATENIMLAACCCDGTTTITNAAREPEIEDLQNFLCQMGANVRGAGSPTVIIDGKKPMSSAEHSVISDRIVAATYLSVVAAAGGEAEIANICPKHISTVTGVFNEAGCKIVTGEDSIYISRTKPLKAVGPVWTMPYPGFATDAQPPVMAATLCADGTMVFVETIFKNRYRHVDELLRMGANIKVEDRVAVVRGVKRLHGSNVNATDLRGGAALVVAALSAEGKSVVTGINHIDRGYDNIETALSELGADIVRAKI